jgi:hypothetical protein
VKATRAWFDLAINTERLSKDERFAGVGKDARLRGEVPSKSCHGPIIAPDPANYKPVLNLF